MANNQHLGFLLLPKLIPAFVIRNLRYGCRSWDVLISKWLSVVLVSSCDSRLGEVARTGGCKGDELLSYAHIGVKLVGGSSFEHLQVQPTIFFEKASK